MKTAFLSNKIQYICISLLLSAMHINTISDFIRSTCLIISWFIKIYRDLSWYIMIYHDVSWFIMIYHDISRYIMIYRCFGWSQWQMSLSRQFLSNKTPHSWGKKGDKKDRAEPRTRTVYGPFPSNCIRQPTYVTN